jgi:putative ABC transport system permease protein
LRLSDLFKFALKALTERKLRAVLTIIGIIIGPATIVALVSATQGYSAAAQSSLGSLGATTLFITPVGRGFSFTDSNVAEVQDLAYVSYALPYHELQGQITQGGQTLSVSVVAIDINELNEIFPTLRLEEGSLPSSTDPVGAVIGSTIANPDITGATNLTVNEVLSVSNLGRSAFAFGAGGVPGSSSQTTSQRSFVVRGILSSFGQSYGLDPDDTVFITLSGGEAILHSSTYTGLMVVASSTSTVTQVENEITNLLGQDVRVTSIGSALSSIKSVTQSATTLLEAVAGTSVLVALIGIMTTQFTSVLERTEEIGVLKALGSSSRGILFAFLAEALVTGLIGGLVGAGVGAALSYFVISALSGTAGLGGFGRALGGTRVASRAGASAAAGGFSTPGGFSAASSAASTSISLTPVITPQILLLAIGLATVVGTVGGLLPAWRASRLTPVEALKRS